MKNASPGDQRTRASQRSPTAFARQGHRQTRCAGQWRLGLLGRGRTDGRGPGPGQTLRGAEEDDQRP